MKYIWLISLFFMVHKGYAQKKLLQLDSYQSWPHLESAGISNNGKFVWYKIENEPVGGSTYIVHAVTTGKEIKFHATDVPKFSNKNNFLLAQGAKDSVIFIDFDLFKKTILTDISSYQLFDTGNEEKMAILSTDGVLSIGNITSQKLLISNHILDFKISPDGTSALVKQKNEQDSGSNVNLLWIDFKTKKQNLVYADQSINNPVFDNSGNQVAFLVKQGNKSTIWYCNKGDTKARKLADQSSAGINDSMSIQPGQFWGFNWDGKQLYFALKAPKVAPKISNPNLTIWSYQDGFLQSDFDNPENSQYETPEYLASLNVKEGTITRLLQNGQRISGVFSPGIDRYFFIENFFGTPSELEWNPKARISYFVCDLTTGVISLLKKDSKGSLIYLHLSPTHKYSVYYDIEFKLYFSYNMTTGKNVPILKDSTAVLRGIDTHKIGGICGWLPDDKGIVINDGYDLFKVDPNGLDKPVNLTQDVGRKNNSVFYPINAAPETILAKDGKTLLSVFDLRTKDWGLYEWQIGTKPEFKQIGFSSYYTDNLQHLYVPLLQKGDGNLGAIQKAKNASVYLLRLEKYNETPNYFITNDYKHYKPISNYHPEKEFNFLTAELHTYTDRSGNSYQGILYKPENFDSTHKYPVIFNYYEISSNLLNYFCYAKGGGGDIDIAYLVSNGYLVFKSDIKSQPGKAGEGALRSVNASAEYLSKFDWIDSTKMAIAGHSFGGFETNYIVTHSNRFAAAVTASGVSNIVSSYNDIYPWGGSSRQAFVRFTSYKMQKKLTDDVDSYIENSPILFADRVTTPLLIMHNPEDGSVDFRQGRSFFIELRSLQKKVWMLSYKGNGHGVSADNHVDYYGRVKAFLDHFLLNKAIPDWMNN